MTDLYERGLEQLAAPIGKTASGDLWLAPSVVGLAPIEDAVEGLRELHFAALGDSSYPFVTAAGELAPEEAQGLFGSTTIAILAHLAVTGADAANVILEAVCDQADLHGGFDGTEGLGASAYLSVWGDGQQTEAMQYYEYLTNNLGMPAIPGGGYETAPIVDVDTGRLGLPGAADLQPARDFATQGQQFGQFLTSLADQGAAGGVPGPHSAAYDLGRGVGDSSTATALAGPIGRSIEAVAEGIEDVLHGIGDLVSGIGKFFENIFGGDSADTKQQREAAVREAPVGQCVPVSQPAPVVIQDNHGTINIYTGSDGTLREAPAQARPSENPPPQSHAVAPHAERCPVADDSINPDFVLPFWHDRSVLAPTGHPVGPGTDGMLTTTAFNGQYAGLQFVGLPKIDELGEVSVGGAMFGLYEEELRVATRFPGATKDITAPGFDRWITAGTRDSRRRAIARAVIVNQLRSAGIDPDDPANVALIRLHRLSRAARRSGPILWRTQR